MDVTELLEVKAAPQAVFDALPARRDRVRFMVPRSGGGHDPVTLGAFAEAIRGVALWLAAGPLKPGERAAVFAPNRVEWGTAALAIQAASGVMVPIYPGSTADQAAYVVRHADARVVFVDTPVLLARILEAWSAYASVRHLVLLDDGLDVARLHAELAHGDGPHGDGDLPSLAEVEAKVVRLSAVLGHGAARHQADPEALDQLLAAVDVDRPGLMLYTSGTSGSPKGVPLTHRNVGVNGADWLRCFAPILEDDMVDLLWLPMSHIFGFGELCLGNTLGFTTYLSDPASVLARMPEVRPQVFMSVPAYWEKLALAAAEDDDPAARLQDLTGGRLTVCLSGGAGLKTEVKQRFQDAGMLVVEGYGLTECSPTLTLNRPDDFRFDAVGKPLASVELKLADDGEILARGASVFAGYHKDPGATAECFTDTGWFKTGDVGRFTEDGFLQIIDRKKDILVTAGGKNVPPANLEVRFRDDPFIEHLLVYGDGHKYLVAAVWPRAEAVERWLVGHAEGEARDHAIRALLAERIETVNAGLARHETIKDFVVIDAPLTVEAGLLTASLKVRRKAVYQRYRDRLEALYQAPRQAAGG